MEVHRDIPAMRAACARLRARGRLGLVATMGALHEGHMALIAAARAGSDAVAATVFVNPAQFGEAADLAAYPRTEARDLEMLEGAGVAAVFVPAPEVMYPSGGMETSVEVPGLSGILLGAARPGHFRGVATVVTKLLNVVQPAATWFGEKDHQQLAVIRKMVRDLDVPVEVHGVPTVREPDGLAMSSRNVRLGPGDRAAAGVLHRALLAGREALRMGAAPEEVEARLREVIAAEPRAALVSADLRDAATLGPATIEPRAPWVMLVAARFGDVLLIDQMTATPGAPE